MNEFLAEAHGRVNLIGEHTDYNDGFVLPTPIPQKIRCSLRLVGNQRVTVSSTAFPGQSHAFQLGAEKKRNHWSDYIQGITRLLAAEGFTLEGFILAITSDIPMGSGLSSSAALIVSALRVLNQAFAFDIDAATVARMAQRVENEFVGAHVGIMDQMSASLGRPGQAMFLDTRSLAVRLIPIPDDLGLAVIHSGISHSLVAGEYNQRRRECEEAARILGLRALRDARPADLEKLSGMVQKRARHVVSENLRVLQAIQALETGKFTELGKLLRDSHDSLRDDYEVSLPEIDTLVEIANAWPGVYGARITGGGFGGSVVMLTRGKEIDELVKGVAEAYRKRTGRKPVVIMPTGESTCI